ncbi:MAG: hypothetical protein F6J86_09170 [Symploca sp. SIO1B1]|nr:hypothetical protein [Symploca sp. SIO1B1]
MSKSDRELLPIFFDYIEQYEAASSHLKRGSLWIPRRCAQQDWVLSVWVYRIFKAKFEIALFLAEDCLLFAKDGGVVAALMYCLSDAYFHTGKMEIHFCGKAQNPTLKTGYEPVVPTSIIRVAHNFGVTITDNSKVISDSQGRELYVRITGFSQELLELLQSKNIDPVRTSFIVNRRVWTREQVELFVRYSYEPKCLLRGGISPEYFLLYQRDLLLLRFALIAERFKTLLETSDDSSSLVIEATWLDMNKQTYSLSEPLSLETAFGKPLTIPNNTSFSVVYIPRDIDEYNLFVKSDFASFFSGVLTLQVVTKDFDWVSQSTHDFARSTSEGLMISIVDTLGELDEEIQKRLHQSLSSRRSPPERPE